MTGIYVPSQPLTSVTTSSSDPLKDLEGSFVVDTAGNVLWLELSYDNISGTNTYTYFSQPNGPTAVPVGDVSPIQDSNIVTLKRCDDVNGDGSLMVAFYRVNVHDEDGLIISSLPQTATGAVYAIQGVETECNSDRETVSSTDNLETADFTIPAGFVHGSLAVVTGQASVNGALYNAGDTVNLPPMSFGAVDRRYPAYAVTGVTGQVRVNYHV